MPHVTIYALCRSSGVLCRKGARADVTNADLPKPTDQMPIRIEKRCICTDVKIRLKFLCDEVIAGETVFNSLIFKALLSRWLSQLKTNVNC